MVKNQNKLADRTICTAFYQSMNSGNNLGNNAVADPEFEVPPVEPVEAPFITSNGGGKKNKNKKKAPTQTDDGWDHVPVSNNKKGGGKNAGKSSRGGGGNSQPPPGFGNKFSGLGSNPDEGQKNGGRNQGAGKKF